MKHSSWSSTICMKSQTNPQLKSSYPNPEQWFEGEGGIRGTAHTHVVLFRHHFSTFENFEADQGDLFIITFTPPSHRTLVTQRGYTLARFRKLSLDTGQYIWARSFYDSGWWAFPSSHVSDTIYDNFIIWIGIRTLEVIFSAGTSICRRYTLQRTIFITIISARSSSRAADFEKILYDTEIKHSH